METLISTRELLKERLLQQKTRVLFVDDDDALLQSMRRAFHHTPFEIYVANSGDSALSALEAVDMTVVVSDHHMPGQCGVDFLSQVQERWPETLRVLLTGYATADLAIDAINKAGIHHLLTKPVPSEDLANVIKHGIEHQRLELIAKTLLEHCCQLESVIHELNHQHDKQISQQERLELEDSMFTNPPASIWRNPQLG